MAVQRLDAALDDLAKFLGEDGTFIVSMSRAGFRDALAKQSPGRLRSCANDECRLFLIDHSKANTARWCSMA